MQRLYKLWQLKSACRLPKGATRMNCLAAIICLTALCILFLSFHATPAGAGLDHTILPELKLSNSRPSATAAGDNSGQNQLTALPIEELNRRIHSAIHGSKLALQLHVAMLEVGKHRIERFPDYTATFLKQERLDGQDLQDMQTVQLKLRHKPFSVYMKWLEGGDRGRQVLFVDEHNDGKLIVKLGGKKGEVLPNLKLEPNGSTAMGESRHPVTEMGLLQLAELILKYRKRDLTLKEGVWWEMVPDQKFMDRPCDCFVVEYNSADIEPVYRKTITYIDRELSLPVCVKNFGWPTITPVSSDTAAKDEATLIEYYGYKDIQFDQRLSDNDFDRANSDYKFRR